MRLIRLLKNDLARESAEWVNDGIIDRQQAEQICARYGAEFDQRNQQSWGYQTLVTLGYLFIGLALITLIGANWDDLPRALRMSGLVTLTVGINLLGWHHYNQQRDAAAQGYFFLGSLFYGASIILIAQIYHLGEHMPDGILFWALGGLLPALLLTSTWLMVNALTLGLIWLFVKAHIGFYPALFPLFILAALWSLRTGSINALLFLMTFLAIGCWMSFSLAWWWGDNTYDFGPENMVVIMGLFLLAQGASSFFIRHGSLALRDYGTVLQIWCLRFYVVMLLLFSYSSPWKELIRETWHHSTTALILMSALITAGGVLIWRSGRGTPAYTGVSAFVLISFGLCIGSNDTSLAVPLQIATNLVLILSGSYLLLQGIKQGVTHYFFTGIFIILTTGFLRYIDLIGDYIGGAILFLFFAAILLGAARYWRKQHSQVT